MSGLVVSSWFTEMWSTDLQLLQYFIAEAGHLAWNNSNIRIILVSWTTTQSVRRAAAGCFGFELHTYISCKWNEVGSGAADGEVVVQFLFKHGFTFLRKQTKKHESRSSLKFRRSTSVTLQIFIHRIQHTYTPSLTVHLKSKALFTSLKIIVLTSNAELADFFF